MTTGSLEVRDLTNADEEQALGVRTRSFGKLDEASRTWWTSVQAEVIAQRRVLGAFDGERLVGTAKGRSFSQFCEYYDHGNDDQGSCDQQPSFSQLAPPFALVLLHF